VSLLPIQELPPELIPQIAIIETSAYSNLVTSNYQTAERLYERYYLLLRAKESDLPSGSKYHKGTPLHNWGIALINQNKLEQGFRKILLAYIEDILDFEKIDDAFNAPAYKVLTSYPLIDKNLLKSLYELAKKKRVENNIPRDPEELLKEVPNATHNLSANFTIRKTDQVQVIENLNPDIKKADTPDVEKILSQIGPKEKRVFIGGNHFNIVLLHHIRDIVEDIDDFKGVIVADVDSALNTHDKSIEILKGCSFAIFEISVSNGHLMEIERATDFEQKGELKFLLLYQGFKTSCEPTCTKMLEKFKDHMARYTNFTELTAKLNNFLTT
jgi:hypothetical protein